MIKVLKIRDFVDRKTNKPSKFRLPIKEAKQAPDIISMFEDIPKLLERVTHAELYNLHYSLAHWADDKGAEFESQEVIPFDIDGMDVSQIDRYVPVVCKTLGVDPTKVGIVYSGNGLHILIATSRAITDPDYFQETKVHYAAVCNKIDYDLQQAGLIAETDTQIWRIKASLRLPFTENRKKDKGVKNCTLVNGKLSLYDFDITSMSELPVVPPEQQVHKRMSKLMSTDGPAVLACPFLTHCRTDAEDLSEPEWYAAVSVVARLENGAELVHQMSSAHPLYSEVETDLKIEQAMELSGARTCDNINTLWKGCKDCVHRGKVNSPISLKSPEFIKTATDGFYNTKFVEGIQKPTTPNYDDLLKYYKTKNTYVNVKNNLFLWDAQHWTEQDNITLDVFAEVNFDPKPSIKMCKEFKEKVFRQPDSLKQPEFFETNGLINFANGVFNTETEAMREATPDDGFTYVLPFEHDKEAKCDRFILFIDEIMNGDTASSLLLVQFLGYVFSAAPPTVDPKALILVGDGANGKSILVDLMMYIMGKENCSATSLYDAIKKPEARVNMKGKLLNITEEVPSATLADSSVFKNLVTGGVLESRSLYKDSMFMRNTAKLVMTCNELPPTTDFSRGMQRRLIIIEFFRMFTTEAGNKDPYILDKLKVEGAGIWNYCYDAYKQVIKDSCFTVPTHVNARIEEYVTSGNPSLLWFGQGIGNEWEVTLDEGDDVIMKDFYHRFRYAAEDNGIPSIKIPPLRTFWNSVRKHYKLAPSIVVKRGGVNTRIVQGIKLIEGGETQGGAF